MMDEAEQHEINDTHHESEDSSYNAVVNQGGVTPDVVA